MAGHADWMLGGDGDALQRYVAPALRTAWQRDSAHELAATHLCEAGCWLALDQRTRSAVLLDQAQPACEVMAMPWHAATAARLRLRTDG